MIKNEYLTIDYTSEDTPKCIKFFQDIFSEMGFHFEINGKDSDLKNIPEKYQTGTGVFWLIKRQKDIVGSLALRDMDNGVLELKCYYVLSDHHQKGLGSKLLNKAIAYAKENHINRILLDTTPQSAKAISMFRKRGFKDTTKYNNNPCAEIYMELKL